jgi:hypothetical protein
MGQNSISEVPGGLAHKPLCACAPVAQSLAFWATPAHQLLLTALPHPPQAPIAPNPSIFPEGPPASLPTLACAACHLSNSEVL